MPQLVAVAGHDEQRVVDTDRQAQHEAQRWRHRIQRHEEGRTDRQQRADSDANHRGEQRQPGREQAGESHPEDDHGHRQSGDLTDRFNGDGVRKTQATSLDGEPRVAGDVHRVGDGGTVLVGDVRGDGDVEAEAQHAGAAVVGHGAEGVRVQQRGLARQPHLHFLLDEFLLQPVVHRHGVVQLEGVAEVLDVLLDGLDGAVHRSHVLGVLQLLALRGLEDDVDDRLLPRVTHLGELLLEQLGGVRGGHVLDFKDVVEALLTRESGRADADEDDQPDADGEPLTSKRPASEVKQELRHELREPSMPGKGVSLPA